MTGIARNRTRGGLVPTPSWPGYWGDYTAGCVTNTFYSAPLLRFKSGTYEEMSDFVIPNYHERVKRGEIFFSPMRRSITVSQPSVDSTNWKHQNRVPQACGGTQKWTFYTKEGSQTDYFISQQGGGTSNDAVPVIQLTDAAELQRLAGYVSTKLQAERGKSDSNLFESMAEVQQTAKMLSQPLLGLASLLQRKQKKRGTKLDMVLQSPKDLAGAWLQYRYGIRPFISDIDKVVTAYYESRHTPSKKKRKTTRVKEVIDISGQTLTVGSWGDYRCDVLSKTREIVTMRAMSLDELTVDLAYRAGLTAKGLLTTPWELVPYSFVVDWFLNVGDFINSLVPAFGWNQLGSCLVWHHDITTEWKVNNYRLVGASLSTGYDIIENPSGTAYAKRVNVSRGHLSGRTVSLKPDFRLSEVTRCQDAAALVVQRLYSLFGRR